MTHSSASQRPEQSRANVAAVHAQARMVVGSQSVNYNSHMVEVVRTGTFDRWLRKLKDKRAAARIEVRIRRLQLGNPGDVEPVGGGVSELKINYGPGYRVYFKTEGDRLILLLCGGDKSSQERDIKEAKRIAKEWRR